MKKVSKNTDLDNKHIANIWIFHQKAPKNMLFMNRILILIGLYYVLRESDNSSIESNDNFVLQTEFKLCFFLYLFF
jgi:hypothetical protein